MDLSGEQIVRATKTKAKMTAEETYTPATRPVFAYAGSDMKR